MTYFIDKDTQWQQTAAAVEALVALGDHTILAPAEFIPEFKRVVAYSLLPQFRADFFDLVVVHKGLCNELGGERLEYWQQEYGVVFANAVFVVFAKHSPHKVDMASDDVISLLHQIPMLAAAPIQSFRPDVDDDYILGDQDLDLRAAVAFLEHDHAQHHLICGPEQLKPIFKHALTPQEIIKTSIGTCDFAVITINSALSFPYQDLLHVAQRYTPVFSDVAVCIFKRTGSTTKTVHDGFAALVISAMASKDYLLALKQYRTTVSARAALSVA